MAEKMKKVSVSDLSGAALDWAVAKADWGGDIDSDFNQLFLPSFHPSTDWSQGGPLIDEYKAELAFDPPWQADVFGSDGSCLSFATGETALIAVCRAVVSAKMGDTVDIPAELQSHGL